MAVSDSSPRVGVFLCNCGTNIGGVVNIPEVAEFTREIPNVSYVQENLHSCSSEGLSKITEAIKVHSLERVVIAACTPRTHQTLFRDACEEAGLNRYLFQMVNIREHDSWVHSQTPEKATEKAKFLVQMAVAKAVFLEPESEKEIEVTPSCLVIGAGISGITAALNLADQGFSVVLVEREKEVGGLLNHLDVLFPIDQKANDFLSPLVEAVNNHENIKVYTSTQVTDVSGFIGHFDVTLSGEDRGSMDFTVGTIIVAVGAEPFTPEGYYHYGSTDSIITQLELESHIETGKPLPKQIAMIQCVGAMEDRGRTYCSRICCGTALKNALKILELNPDTDIHILYRELQTYGIELEALYRQALDKGVKFLKFLDDRPPEVKVNDDSIRINIWDPLVGVETSLSPELLVLSTPLIPAHGSRELATILRVPVDSHGFFLEAHPKMRPVDFSSDGIFLCGSAHSPKNIPESISQALAAAARASIPMRKGKVKTEAVTAWLDSDICVGCGACASVCPFDAITWSPTGLPVVNEAMCKGCGVCSVECPVGAMQLRYFKDDQLVPAIRGILADWTGAIRRDENEPNILCFACRWCSYAAADFAGVMRLKYPTNTRILLVPCSGRVDFRHILEAYEQGADGVVVTGCLKDQCHYVDGNILAEQRVNATKKALKVMGIEEERLEMFFCSAGMPREFAEYMNKFTERIKEIGRMDRKLFSYPIDSEGLEVKAG